MSGHETYVAVRSERKLNEPHANSGEIEGGALVCHDLSLGTKVSLLVHKELRLISVIFHICLPKASAHLWTMNGWLSSKA